MAVMVYRHGGRDGLPFDYKTVEEGDLADALKDGWFDAPPKKADKAVDAAKALDEAVEAVTPATREELETMAKELGVKFNSRTSDEKLLERLAEATD